MVCDDDNSSDDGSGDDDDDVEGLVEPIQCRDTT